ncbi:MAG: SUMF1/EgtB/PvdO family nonheme iron enzyme [Anaerolineales bacterium]|nr:SUMF1/EgtB/PvdO family nonheme iron enzyme [Anaerolineales bacterium]
MAKTIPYLTVFISSPGDVGEERKFAQEIIERFPYRPAFRDKVSFRIVAWDKPGADTAMRGSLTPQEAINQGLPKPSESDLVITIFGARMGTPFTDMDGKTYESGTHWELLDALNNDVETLIYRRTSEPTYKIHDDIDQHDRLKAFFRSEMFFKDGKILRGVNEYAMPDNFRIKFDTHFEEFVVRVLGGDAIKPSPKVVTHEQLDQYFAVFAEPLRARRKKDVGDIARGTASEPAPYLPHVSISSVVDDVLFADDDEPEPVMAEGDYQRHDQHQKQRIINLREKLLNFKRGVLLGQPGGGKTWTLLMLMLDYHERWKEKPDETLIPVFIPLNSYDGEVEFDEFIRQQMGVLAPFYGALLPRLMLLCDALNEMPNQDVTLPKVKKHLKDKPHFIVSCRVLDYQQKLDDLRPLEILNLRELDLSAIKRLIETYIPPKKGGAELWQKMGGSEELFNWNKVIEKGESERFWDAKAGSQYQDTNEGGWYHAPNEWHEMHKGARLIPLCRSPFMASLLCGVYLKNQGALPLTRGELFETFIHLALQDQQKRNEKFPSLDEVKRVLVELAEVMQAQKVTVLPRAGKDVPEVMRQASLIDAGIASSLLSGNREQVRFQHQLFQEYFATRVLLRAMEVGESPAPFFGEEWWEAGVWRETVVILGELLGGVEGANCVVRWLAPVSPEIALSVILQHGAGLTVNAIEEATKTTLLDSINTKTTQKDPRGRASAYRVLGLADWDTRPGVGLTADGLPDIVWGEPMPSGEHMVGGYGIIPDGYDFEVQPSIWGAFEEHQVTIDQSYCLSKYPITYKQLESFFDSEFGSMYKRSYQQGFQYRNSPADNVGFRLAIDFCDWLSHKMGLIIRLPTEYEWEIYARYPDNRYYPFGNNLDGKNANTMLSEVRQTSAVGIFPESDTMLGCADMFGNVWEWCLECDGNGFNYGRRHGGVLRGDSWNLSMRGIIPLQGRAFLDGLQGSAWNAVGFRLCLVL